MKNVDYAEFSDGLHARLSQADDRAPLDGMIELTRLCSVKCVHCYIGDARWTKDPAEMSTDEVKRLLDVLAERGTLWLCFTGGEAMVRRDFRELWIYAKKKGFILTLFSNATLIDDSMARFLHDYPPFNLEISIYGASEEVYENVTQIKGSYKRFFRGVENIMKYKLPWKMKTVLIKENAHELEAMKNLADRWRVSFKFDGNINPSIGEGTTGGQAPCATRVDGEVIIGAQAKMTDEFDQLSNLRKRDIIGRPENLFSCGAGKNSFYVSANGGLQMCILTGHRSVDLKLNGQMQQNFDGGWQRFGGLREIKRRPDSPCLTCDIATLCDNCPGFAHLENGDENSAVEFLCRSAHLKARAMGVPHRCDIRHFVYKRTKDGKEKETPLCET